MAASNGNCKAAQANDAVFPEALASLKQADPEIYSIIQDEKARQWWVACAGFSSSVLLVMPGVSWVCVALTHAMAPPCAQQEGHRADCFGELHITACDGGAGLLHD